MKLNLGLIFILGWTQLHAADDSEPSPLARALGQACWDGNLNEVTVLIDQGAPVNGQSAPYRDTPLIAVGNHADIVKYLLAHGADLKGTDDQGNTAVHTCAFWHYPASLRVLLEAGANPNQPNKYGRLPLMNAASKGFDDIVKMLLDYHADVNGDNDAGPALWRAAEKNHVSTLKMLLDAGADIKLGPKPVLSDGRRWSLMTEMADDKCIDALDFLLDHGLDINEASPDGQTGLMEAVINQQPRVVADLIKRGAKVDLANEKGKTALMFAADWFGPEILDVILSAHPDINAADQNGMTPIMWALGHNEPPDWAILIQHGANLTARDKQGRTPLIQVAQRGHLPAILFLLEHGADVNAVDQNGRTALANAGERGRVDIVETLKSHGARQTAVHITPREKPVPALSSSRAWALAAAAIYCQIRGDDPFILGNLNQLDPADERDDLKKFWDITDAASCHAQLEWLRTEGHRREFQQRGLELAKVDDAAFKTLTMTMLAPAAEVCRDSYKKWKERSGLAWDLVRYINLVNLCYSAKYLTEDEAWNLIMPVARELQKNFSSWQEMSDNFLDGRAIWNHGERDPAFEACSKLLLDPREANSPWNQSRWDADLSER